MILHCFQQNEKKVYSSFRDGRLIKGMNITGTFILLRLYLDAFSVNDPLRSSSNKNRILGFYYSAFSNLKVASKRSTVQTLCLVDSKDVAEFGLSKCLEKPIMDLKNIVINGIYDEKFQTFIQIHVICCLGDNLGKESLRYELLPNSNIFTSEKRSTVPTTPVLTKPFLCTN